MAKSRSGKRHSTGTTITTKSWFGSHTEMVVEELDNGKVICEDNRGRYITDKNRLDNGLADQNRASLKRI